MTASHHQPNTTYSEKEAKLINLLKNSSENFWSIFEVEFKPSLTAKLSTKEFIEHGRDFQKFLSQIKSEKLDELVETVMYLEWCERNLPGRALDHRNALNELNQRVKRRNEACQLRLIAAQCLAILELTDHAEFISELKKLAENEFLIEYDLIDSDYRKEISDYLANPVQCDVMNDALQKRKEKLEKWLVDSGHLKINIESEVEIKKEARMGYTPEMLEYRSLLDCHGAMMREPAFFQEILAKILPYDFVQREMAKLNEIRCMVHVLFNQFKRQVIGCYPALRFFKETAFQHFAGMRCVREDIRLDDMLMGVKLYGLGEYLSQQYRLRFSPAFTFLSGSAGEGEKVRSEKEKEVVRFMEFIL